MKKKIIYSDMDGTLLNYENGHSYLSNKNIESIEKWINSGGYFSVATGRNIASALKFFEKIKLKPNLPVILTNGALVYDLELNKIIHQDRLNQDIIDEAISYAEINKNVTLMLLTSVSHIIVDTNSNIKLSDSEYLFSYQDKDKIDFSKVVKLIFVMDPKKQKDVYLDIEDFNTKELFKKSTSSPYYIELVNKETSKITGIKKALEYMKIENYDLYSIGDYLNDMEMLLNSKVSFAPRNAVEEVLSSVSRVLNKSNNDAAVSEMIKILIEEEV